MTAPLIAPIAVDAATARRIATGRQAELRRLPGVTVDRIKPGARLWLREPFHLPRTFDQHAPTQYLRVASRPELHFAAEGTPPSDFGARRFARALPRALSRITLRVKAVRFEPLQDIGDAAIEASGAGTRDEYAHDWDRLVDQAIVKHPADRWAGNPTVAVIAFTADHRNIDALSETDGEEAARVNETPEQSR